MMTVNSYFKLLVLFTCMLPAENRQPDSVTRHVNQILNIVFIGNSITEGGGLDNPDTDAPPVHAINWLRRHHGGSIAFSNQGHSGYTTVNFLPSTDDTFNEVEKAADSLQKTNKGELIFSMILGTNDSAEDGPLGSPVSPENYRKNVTAIIDRLLSDFPGCIIVLHRPTWYSPTTYNSSRYLAVGLKRLQQYFPELDAIAKAYATTHPLQVFAGDKNAYSFFEKNYTTHFITEQGQQGIFYLHPNSKGAKVLGEYWGMAIGKVLKNLKNK